jgi:dTDP-4-amino-4,6-dideoxygalactose transaminase
MKAKFLPINDLARWDVADLADITKCLTDVANSGNFMRGPHTAAFESELSQILNYSTVVCVGNGTDALVLSLLSLGIKHGDKVVTVANAGGYATGAILRVGAIPILVDVDLITAQMSIASLIAQLETNADVKAVIVTHLYGLMASIQMIKELTSSKGILLIEDCAQAIGAKLGEISAGAWGDASTFSFYPTKNLACLGDGGAVAFKKSENAEVCRRLAQYGWSERYVISEANGMNSRLDEVQAAILRSRLKRLNHSNQVRRSIVNRYSRSLDKSRYMICSESESFVGHLAVMVSPSRQEDIDRFRLANVGYGIHYPVLDHQQPAWSVHFVGVSLPNSEKLVDSIVTLPCFPLMTDEEISRFCDVLKSL